MRTALLNIKVYEDKMPITILAEILDLAQACNIGEEFDSSCDLIYTWVVDEKIVAVIALKKTLFSDGRVIPRWEHIFYSKEVKTTKKALMFLLNVEQMIMEYGFTQLYAYVGKTRQEMYDYAVKFGFKPYATDSGGDYLSKNIKRRI